jgi:hypothetical protein
VLTQRPRPKTELTSESEWNVISVVSSESTACTKGSMSASVVGELLASWDVRLRRRSAFSGNNQKTAEYGAHLSPLVHFDLHYNQSGSVRPSVQYEGYTVLLVRPLYHPVIR